MNVPVIEMRDIVKRFGDFTANDGINLTVHKGEIHAILGENGAGKSTLMNQLYGLLKPTSGDILVNGKKIEMNNPRDAIDAGIGMVHQHFMLVQPFTVTENIVLGAEPVKGVKLDMATARKNVVEISERYGLAIDQNIAGGGLQQSVKLVHQRGLARAVFAQDCVDLALVDDEVDAIIGCEITELLDDVPHLNDGLCHVYVFLRQMDRLLFI